MNSATDWRDMLGALRDNMEDSAPDIAPDNSREDNGDTTIAKQHLRIDIEKKGRGGKTATIISGFNVSDQQLADIAADIKKRLGTGGSARGGEILIQGQRRDDVVKVLKQMGLI